MKIAATLAMLSTLAVSPQVSTDLSSRARIPDDERDTALRAANMAAAERYEEAEGLYRVIIQEHPDCVYAWFNLGVVRFRQKHYDAAHDALTQALTLNSKDEACLADIAIVETEMKRYTDASEHLQAAIAINPTDSFTHELLSQCYDALGRRAEADAERARADEIEQERAMHQFKDKAPDDITVHSS